MEFRILREARDRYAFPDVLFRSDGDALVADPDQAHLLAGLLAPGDEEARGRIALEISALGLMHELCHRAIAVERRRAGTSGGPLARALRVLAQRFGQADLAATLEGFEVAFPSSPVYAGRVTPERWLDREGAHPGGHEEALEEMALLWVANRDPAAAPYAELFDDACLGGSAYAAVIRALRGIDLSPDEADAERVAPAGPLLERLLAPIAAAPHSLADQLRFIRTHWAGWLDDADLARLDREIENLAEAERATWLRYRRPPTGDMEPAATGPALAIEAGEPVAFSLDRDWMPKVVMLVKSTYVWLDQLSRQHGREIRTLDAVPDEELDLMAGRGFTALWLIGIWERSGASARIKRMRGNPEAVASAYSIADYRIADDLGGESAWQDLRDRALARGVRLAGDMVPNHMGIDSSWVMEHPERFIGRADPPFASYTFTGPDLSSHPRAAVRLEDHYWDSTDAAVVFERTERASGERRYIYHGNDGTSFPWNDTAQLDFLKAEVREAVIEEILEVARRFPIIRFDAAMVLVKRHIQRLWYPPRGHEAGIPSRSEAALSRADFERALPEEFWRGVVDRVAAEAPDTLLLAEAFWMLEGYFVRSLGMHRVYNSAFMHMLRDERNAAYQRLLRETVDLDRRILGRYVNFMSNPDERTAVDQFGSREKYFGVATLLATLPGLPMFGHGQAEGFAERYGMEYRRAYHEEEPDAELVARHAREIFPLLRQRWRFAHAEGFRLLEAVDEAGSRVDDVFAYANRAPIAPAGEEGRSLVVYLNRYEQCRVHVLGVAEALGVANEAGRYLVLHDQRSGRQLLRAASELHTEGLELDLDGYDCRVFLGFEELTDGPAHEWSRLAWRLGGGATPDVHAALRELLGEPVRDAVRTVFDVDLLRPLAGTAPLREGAAGDRPSPAVLERVTAGLVRLRDAAGTSGDPFSAAEVVATRLARAAGVDPPLFRAALAGWVLGEAVANVTGGDATGIDATGGVDTGRVALDFDAWGLGRALGAALHELGEGDADIWRATELARALLAVAPGTLSTASGLGSLPGWLADPAVRQAVGWQERQGCGHIVREAWDELLDMLAARDGILDLETSAQAAVRLKALARQTGYQVEPDRAT